MEGSVEDEAEGGAAGATSGTARWWWVAVAVVALAVAVNAAVAASHEWAPTFDNAFISVKVLDVGTGATPLVGMPTTLSEVAGEPVSHPGPLQFWMLAPLVRALMWTPLALMLAQAMLTAAWLAAVVGVTRASGLRVSPVAVVAVVALFVWTLGAEIPHDPWNPHAAVVPLGVALWCAALAAGGHHRAAWLAVLAGSFAAQCHLGFSGPGIVLAATGLAAACVAWSRRAVGARRSAIVALVVGVLAWSGPLVDQITGSGNLTALLGAGGGDEDPLGARTATDRLVHHIVPPGWLFDRHVTAGELLARASPLAIMGAGALLALTIWFCVRLRRSQPVLTALGVLSIVSLAAVWTLTTVTPATFGAVFGIQNVRAFGPPVVGVWVVILAGLADVVRARRPAAPSRWVQMVAPVGAGVLSAVAVVQAGWWLPAAQRDSGWFDPVREVSAMVTDEAVDDPIVYETLGTALESELGAGLFAELLRRRVDVLAAGPVTEGLVDPSHLAAADTVRPRLILVVGEPGSLPPVSPGELGRTTFTVDDVTYEVVVVRRKVEPGSGPTP